MSKMKKQTVISSILTSTTIKEMLEQREKQMEDEKTLRKQRIVAREAKKGYCSCARISSQSSRHCWRSPLPHASALIHRDFGCVLAVQPTKLLPHVAKVDLVC
ncbi:hypothetical protein TNCV_3361151 [Trichonephila clavipes]|nr:hypothetical protein TNCV_3361151 [Trichonephila clavipes]